MLEEFGISKDLEKLAEEVEEEVKEQYKEIDRRALRNSMRVLKALQDNKISDVHFNSTTGYGYGDIVRDTIEKVFEEVLHTEDDLVRNQFI